jgi:hypothetical protein
MEWVTYWRDVALPYALDKAREAIAQRDEANQLALSIGEHRQKLELELAAFAALDVPKPAPPQGAHDWEADEYGMRFCSSCRVEWNLHTCKTDCKRSTLASLEDEELERLEKAAMSAYMGNSFEERSYNRSLYNAASAPETILRLISRLRSLGEEESTAKED